ncbi:hypothetical protein [Aureimonas sp. AU40]|uniref:hypothetical protein n=1 Tax=Aureimonas sp. AU40 TaxID=1637747 RepID=UPI000781630E|nr:hypothetical protein [Aureimonas sp. AU40]
MDGWTIEWDRGRVLAIPTGGMAHHLQLRLADGRVVEPFAEAPWHGEPDVLSDTRFPAHLRTLGGEWPCVPFGTGEADPAHHGHGSNADWQLVEQGERHLRLACDFPAGHAVERLEREIRAVEGEAAVEFTLRVVTRVDCALPIGLHPIFRLPAETAGLRVEPAPFAKGQVFPETFQPDVSRLRPNALFDRLDAIDTVEGDHASLAALPAAGLGEELVQLWRCEGAMSLEDTAAATRVRFTWDPAAFPHCLLWVSQGGRDAAPWNGRFRGLGVEPIASAFDRGDLIRHAAFREGTAQAFRAGEPWETSYRIEAEAL